MKKTYAYIENGAVVRVHKFLEGRQPDGMVEVTDATGPAGVGYSWDGSTFAPPAGPSDADRLDRWRSRASLSRTQFFIACRQAGLLNKVDAAAAARGETITLLSDALSAAVSAGSLTQSEADDAEIQFAGATKIDRANPSVELMRGSMNSTEEQLDALFGWSG